jgi:outer membrane protein, multidrug efflux system
MKIPCERLFLFCSLFALANTHVAFAAREKVKTPVLPNAYERTGASFDASLSSTSIDQWWRAFNDPALNALEDEALEKAPEARIAAERLIEARQTRRREKSETGPRGAVSGTISRQRNYELSGGGGNNLAVLDGTTDTLSAVANFSYELDLLGRQAALRRAAAAAELVERFGGQAAIVELTSQIASDYFACQGLAARLATATAQSQVANQRAEVARRKASSGLGSPQEVWRLAVLKGDADAEVERLTAQLTAQKRQLLLLVGRGTDQAENLVISNSIARLPSPVYAAPSELLIRRPDLRQAEFRLKSILSRARYRHLSVFPSISFLPALGLSRTPFPQVSLGDATTPFSVNQQNKTQGFWLFGFNINIPTLDIPRLLAEARAEDSRARQAAISYERAAQIAYRDAQNAIVNLDNGRRAAEQLEIAKAQAQAVYAASRRRHRIGLDDEAAWLDAEETWLRVQQTLINEQVENLRRQAQLYKALGGGVSEARKQPS